MNNFETCVVLNLISGIGYIRFKALCEKFGSADSILNAKYKDLINIGNIGTKLAEKIVNWEKTVDLEKELNLIKKSGVKVLTICDDKYPYQLKETPDPPLCLYIRGELKAEFSNSIAVVGSRRITSYGREMTQFLTSSLAYAGWHIVSGLAYGVDAAAHQATIDSSGITTAVLGGGLARLHPQDNISLARNIIEKGGAVISEFPMELSPTRRTFPMRNRVISGLCCGVLVIEAGVKSGSLITAGCALEQGRMVFAVPGRANSPLSKGCNKLIKDGAILTENLDDILKEFEFLPGILSCINKSNDSIVNTNSISDKLVFTAEENLILECLELEEKNIDTISVETELPIGKLLALLVKLEMRKVIKQIPGKRFKMS